MSEQQEFGPGHAFFGPDGAPVTMGDWLRISTEEAHKEVVERVVDPQGREHIVRTRYLGIDHCSATLNTCNCPPGPWAFATYVNGELKGHEVRNYRSWDDALAGHPEVVAALAKGRDPRLFFYVPERVAEAPTEGCER